MSYRIEGSDIVIDGFQDGIADSPYLGIGDMRNINTTSVSNEASVEFQEVAAAQPPTLNAVAFTASASTDRLTWAGPNTLYEDCAISVSASASVNYLVVAGGGGGAGGNTNGNAGAGGGGGAGGMKTGSLSLAAAAYTITVGAGGAAGANNADGGVGNDSSIAALAVSTAGGKGATRDGNGGNGGSGGGGGGRQGGSSTTLGGTGVVGQGNDGGGQTSNQDGSGGGGGAGSIGGSTSTTAAGAAGTGSSSSISGGALTYAAGGAGAAFNGGDGAAGTANRGNGGGGGGGGNGGSGAHVGGAGGSGIVVLSYTTGTATATGGTITTSGGNTIHTFTTSGTFTVVSGLTNSVVYYVRNISGVTFQVSLAPTGSVVDITGDSSGTFTTYQYGNQRGIGSYAPMSYVPDRNRTNGAMNALYLTDASNYIWCILPAASGSIPANSLIFLGNIGGVGASGISVNGIVIWKRYMFIFNTTEIDYANLSTLWTTGPAATWTYSWWNAPNANNVNGKISMLVGQDDTIYYTSSPGVGSILENTNQTFDPTNSATYTRTASALTIPTIDSSTCLAELGTSLLVGGVNSLVYPWDRVSPSFAYPLIIPDYNIARIIGTNQNAYIFAGNQGRIFITNGASVELYKKLPTYITGNVNPYIQFKDASYARNQLYFSFTASSNADADLANVNGAWAIDLTTDSFRMKNKITNSGYSGQSTMVVEMPPASSTDQPSGTALTLGWTVNTTYGVDVGSSSPYQALESYIDLDMIPVGTYLNPLTPTQIEWKTSYPLGGNGTAETIKISYRTNLLDSFTQVGTTTATGTSVVGTTTGTTTGSYAVSDYYQTNFQKAQWIQLRVEMSSNSTTPTFNRLTEIRIRDFQTT